MPEEKITITKNELKSIILGYCSSALRKANVTAREESLVLLQIETNLEELNGSQITSLGFQLVVTPREKTKGGDCFKRCEEKEKSLGVLYPKLAKEWDDKRNGGYTAFDIFPHSSYNAHWKCKKGHRWQASVYSRTRRNGCPYCSGRLAIPGKTDFGTLDVGLVRHWHRELNEGLDPTKIPLSSRKEVWWICDCGNTWKNSVFNESRNMSHRCKECKRKSKFAFPE